MVKRKNIITSEEIILNNGNKICLLELHLE